MFSEIGKIITENNNFAIVSHTSPDGDSMGSILALYNMLKENGKQTDVFIDGEVPKRYSFLPCSDEIIQIESAYKRYSTLFVLDCGDAERLGKCKELINRADAVINIDHHISNNKFGNVNYVDSYASSTGELIFELFSANDFKISENTAECLYTAILTDTGGFKYSNTTSKTFNICGKLIDVPIDFSDITSRIYDTKTIPQIKLLSKVTTTLEMFLNNKVAMLYLSKDMLTETNSKEEDASEFVNIARDIENVEIGIFLKQLNDNEYRVSLRSKNYADVRKVAEVFGGGGHIRASGCTIKGNLNQIKNKLITEISTIMDVVI